MYDVSTQGVDERMINVHYYYCYEPSNLTNFIYHCKICCVKQVQDLKIKNDIKKRSQK